MDKDNSVIVFNLPEELADVAETYLESTKKGGGKIESFFFDKARQRALVTFESSNGEFGFQFHVYTDSNRMLIYRTLIFPFPFQEVENCIYLCKVVP